MTSHAMNLSAGGAAESYEQFPTHGAQVTVLALNFDIREASATDAVAMTQFRRLCKQATLEELTAVVGPFPHSKKGAEQFGDQAGLVRFKCPYGQPGDRRWVREEFALSVVDPDGGSPNDDPENWDVIYRADPGQPGGWTDCDGNSIDAPWRRAIHMPRWASRILVEIVNVRVERLHDISEADARACGAAGGQGSIPGYIYAATPVEHYRWIWNNSNKSTLVDGEAWDVNSWVWVVDFKVVHISQHEEEEVA